VNDFSFGERGPKDFDIRVSTTTTDDSAFTTVYSGTLSGVLGGPQAQEFLFPTPVDAKYVEFYWKNSYSGSNIGVRELAVLADSAKGSTLLGYSSSNDPLSYGPENALDIDTLSPWRTGNSQTTDQWLKLSLPGSDLYTIDHVALMPGSVVCGFSCSDFNVSPKDFEVQVSTTDANDSSFVTAFAGTLKNTNLLQHFSFTPVQARYVRLLLKNNYGSSVIALNSFHVYTSDHAGSDPGFVDQSTDSDGHVVAWSWNFGDGGASNQQSPSHHYAAAGTYTVTLTVTDDAGLTATHQLNLKVGATSGAPSFTVSPVFATEGAQFVRLTDTTSLMMQAFGHRLFDFGNGGPVLDLQQATYYPYQIPDSGNFNVTMTLGDNNSLKAIVTQPFTVRNLPPSVTVQPGKTVVWGESWTNTPTISDPSLVDSQSLHGVWNFGDGQTSTCDNCNNNTATITHAYALPGTYNAALTITDKDGGAASASAVYTVNRRPTALVFQTPPSQTSGNGLVITATLMDTFANVPLANKPVQLSLNGASFNTVTGGDGVASVSVPLPPGTKIDILTGIFAGDSLYLNCGGVTVPATAGGNPPNGTPSNFGTDFWLMFPQNFINTASQKLFITSPANTTGTVTVPGSNFTQNFSVQANTVTTVQLPNVQVTQSDLVQNQGVRIVSAQPVGVYGLNQLAFTSDAYLALPVNALGREYYVLAYTNNLNNFLPGSQFGVVATADGTTVTITPSTTIGTRAAGVPYNIALNQGQTYLLRNTDHSTEGDVTGSRVASDKPIAVFGSHMAAVIPAEACCWADHVVEELTPTAAWGKRFATIPIATRTKGDFFRIIAAEDNTEIYLNSSLTAVLNHGQWVERNIQKPAEIISTKPIMVAQYAASVGFDVPASGEADPLMMIIPPYSQFLDHYTVSTPQTGFAINYANVVAPTEWLGEISMDGEPIPDWMFSDIGVSGYSGAQVPISVGAHNFDGPVSFGVFIYGFSQDEGYGYPGGMNLAPASQNINVAIAPETLARPINGQACLVATITNQEQSPLGGRTVTFAATGANTANGSANTNAAGQAQFCYTGTSQGTDLLRASIDSFSATASIQWLTDVPNQAPVVNAGADQTVNLPAPISLQGSATDDGLPSNTLNVTWSRVSGPGNVTFTTPSSLFTSATFSAAGVYVLRLTANDLVLTSTDEVQITVNPVPTNHGPTANAGPDQSAAIKGNLIVNPGNDLPLLNGEIPGWIEEQGTSWSKGNSSIPGLPDPHRGNSFFWVGTEGGYAELRQDIDVSAYAAGIATGTQQFEIQAYIRQVIECFIPDIPQVTVEFRNAQNNAVLGTAQSFSGYAPNWALVQGVNTAPVGTGWIRVRLIAINNCGPTADVYFDSISLRPVGNAAVKLNGAVNDDGLPFGSSVSAHWTAVSGPAPVTFSSPDAANSGALFTTPGTYVLRLTSTDGQLSASDDTTVTISPQDQAPVVSGTTQQTITLPDSALLNGIVSDDGLPLGSSVSITWKKDSGPGIVTFSNPNAAVTTASFSTPGFYALSFNADDSEYASTTPFYVSVNSPNSNQAPVVDAGPDRSIVLPTNSTTLNGNVADDGLPAGSTLQLQWTQVSGPAPATFANAGSAVTNVQLSTAGTYVLRLTASDGQLSASDDVSVTVIAQNQRPTVNAGPDAQTILSQPVQLNGSASDDGLPVGNTPTTTWTEFSGPGMVTFGNLHAPVTGAQFSAVGTYVLRLTVNDGQLAASDDVTIVVNNDVPGPAVQITAPADDASVTEPTPVTGSVSGGDWKLEYSMDSTDDASTRVWTTFAGGSGMASGTLGTIDPTMMLNGLFDIRLSSTDQYGQTSRTKVSVIVERNLKIGNFTVSFTDLSIPVAGVPMEVTRTYDSRDKRVGDFGFGWTLGLNNIRVEKSSVVGLKWYETVSQEVFPNYCLQALGSHTVTVTFPGGKVFKFQPQVAPQCQRNAPITAGTLSFTPTPGTVGKLEIVGNADVQIDGSVPGPVNLIGFGAGVDIFNSFVFKFTAEDGTSFIIDQRTGLQSLSDLSGNTLTISANGIVHSSGKSIVFRRDIAGRIESITDPNGNSMFYEYDEHGDLISFTDNENDKSIYSYDSNHRLLTMKDPRGIQPVRNDYDASGRLISSTDAFGKVITYVHDLTNRTETVTDRLGNPTTFVYDDRGNVLRKTDARGGVTVSTYDANDNQLSETNALGKTTSYTYDADNNRNSITDPLNNVTHFTFDGFGRVLTTTDPLGRVTTNTYNAAGNLLTAEDGLHNITRYTYSLLDGQVISMTDALNNTTTYEYTHSYRTRETDPLGRVTTFTNDTNGNRLSQTLKRTNAAGQLETITTTFEYDKLSRKTKTTFADGSFTKIEYNAIGQRSATIDQLGHRTEFTYDDMGRLLKTTYADGTHEDVTYDAEGHKLTSTDRGGQVITYTYDELGRLTKTTFADGSFNTTSYDAIGRVSSATDERGNTTLYEYDPNCGCSGRRSKVTDALGHETTFVYDGAGNQLSMTDSRGNTTSYEYDANNRRIKTTFPDSSFATITYDSLGRNISKTDQAGRTTQFAYESPAGLIKVTDDLGQETRFAYDELGNQISQTDALNRTTRYEYDQLGRRTKRILPGGQTETSTYFANGQLQSRVDFNGKTTTYSYDLTDRLLTRSPDASLNQTPVVFTYNARGQRLSMSDASGTSVYTYDGRARLISKQAPQGTLTYTYDSADNLLTTRSSNASGVSVDYGYDALNRLATVKDNLLPNGANTTVYTYDDVGNVLGYNYPNGVKTAQTYNSLNRLTSQTISAGLTNLAGYSYTLGPSGNRLSVTEQSGRAMTYTYDSLYRLTSETISGSGAGANGSISYGYDAVGNRLTRTSNLPAVASTTNIYDSNDRVTSDSYDNNGNTTHANNTDYTYDFESRLTTANGGVVSFVYDGDGNRVAKTVNGVTTQYLVDVNNPTGNSQVVDELAGGHVTRSYTFGHNLISQRQMIGGQWQVSFYGYDGQGNVRFLTDSARAITDTYEFDAFGNLIGQTGNTPNEHLYVGEHFDANLGFYYLRARYLNPDSGRFLTLDSFEGVIFDPVSLHKYLYAGADPVDRSDPTGHFFALALSAAGDLGANGWGGIMGAAFLEYIKFLLIGIAITVITATTIEIAKRIQIPVRVYHYTDWITFGKIVASNQINNPFGTGNYFSPDVYLFEETARERLAVCKPLSVALSLNVYLSTDGFGPTTPVKPQPCLDGVKKGQGNEMFTMQPVPYLTRQPSFHPLF
jgi:RHS repeat-associated protein